MSRGCVACGHSLYGMDVARCEAGLRHRVCHPEDPVRGIVD